MQNSMHLREYVHSVPSYLPSTFSTFSRIAWHSKWHSLHAPLLHVIMPKPVTSWLPETAASMEPCQSPEESAIAWLTVALPPVNSHMPIGCNNHIIDVESMSLFLFHSGVIHEHLELSLEIHLHTCCNCLIVSTACILHFANNCYPVKDCNCQCQCRFAI